MKTTTKKWFMMLIVLLVVLAMAACGGKGSDGNDGGGGGGNTPISLNRVVLASNPIVGDWGVDVTSTATFALSFYPNGTYIMWDEGAHGGSGVEFGTYTSVVSASSVTITVTSIVDDQGDNPADPANASGLTEQAGQTKTANIIIVDNNTIQVPDGSGGTFTLHRTVDVNNPIVGSWGVGVKGNGSTPNSVLLIVFYANGTYIHYGNDSNETCHPGAEYGTYQYDAATSTLTATAIVDNNGDQGLTNDSGTSGTMTMSVTGDLLTVNGGAGTAAIPDITGLWNNVVLTDVGGSTPGYKVYAIYNFTSESNIGATSGTGSLTGTINAVTQENEHFSLTVDSGSTIGVDDGTSKNLHLVSNFSADLDPECGAGTVVVDVVMSSQGGSGTFQSTHATSYCNSSGTITFAR